MTYELYRYVFLGGAILSAIMLVVTVILFFVLRIPEVVGDLTGANAKKAIESIRMQNAANGNMSYPHDHHNRSRGKLTDKISQSGRIIKNSTETLNVAAGTEKIGTQKLTAEMIEQTSTYAAEETTLLSEETTLLSNETTVLSGETTLLSENAVKEEPPVFVPVDASSVFTIEYEITYVHTSEIVG